MQTLTPTLAEAVRSPGRTPVVRLSVWLDGDAAPPTDFTPLVADWSVGRTPQDTPDQVSRMAGSIAAEASIILDKRHSTVPDQVERLSRDLAPYVGTDSKWLAADYGIGLRVQLWRGFTTTAQPVAGELVPLFVGRIDRAAVRADGSVELTCLDPIVDLQGDVSLPVTAIANDVTPLAGYSVVEHVLRTGGFYRTPPPLGNSVLSVPSLLPEIGDVAAPLTPAPTNLAGLFTYTPSPGNDNAYLATDFYAPQPGLAVVIEGWFKAASIPNVRELVRIAVPGGTPGREGLRLFINMAGRLRFSLLNGDYEYGSVVDNVWPNDGAWHYLYFELQHSWPQGMSWFARIDNTAYTGQDAGISMLVPDNGSRRIILGGLAHEGVSIRYAPLAGFTRQTRQTWQPTYSANVIGATSVVRAIPRDQSGKAIDLIREMATAWGAVFRWTEDGTWRWEGRQSWIERRVSPPVADYDDARALVGAGYGYTGASRLRSVTVDWTDYTLVRSTVAAPAWKADELITIPARSAAVMDFETDLPITGILPVVRTSTLSAAYSSVQVVPAYQVGDPAAMLQPGLQVQLSPTPTGFRARLYNGASVDIALWDPSTMDNAFVVHGWTLQGGDAKLWNQDVNPAARDTLTLPASAWRQDRAAAISMAAQIASDTALPAAVFDDLTIVSDPALTVDDIIRARDPQVMASYVTCQVIGIDAAEAEDRLTVRACWPATGPVLDVTGRSELDSITLAV